MACCSYGHVPCFGGDDADADNTSSRYMLHKFTAYDNVHNQVYSRL